MSESHYFQRGFGLKGTIEGTLKSDYHSALVERMRDAGHRLVIDDLTIRLAREFGFCYGVDRAVEYAYETVVKFPDRRVFLTGEIIHNPHVNDRLRRMGIRFFPSDWKLPSDLSQRDVVILPAFGVPAPVFDDLNRTGCILVDTTCGSVLNVWKNVERYAQSGFTSVIHGKFKHEETRATASRAMMYPDGRYVIVRNMEQAEKVCDYIVSTAPTPADRDAFMAIFEKACSPCFDPDRHLERLGVANQTTMLSSESLAIAERLREAMVRKYGEESARERFRSFDTICSATQDRQDAVKDLLQDGVDVLLIIGGYNSSNTNHLASMGSLRVPTYHINSADCIRGAGAIRHKPVGTIEEEEETADWLPAGRVTVGVTAGASTPNVMIGEVIERVLSCRGLTLDAARAGAPR